ncbi:MAG: metal ABC transporter substrate-binding protein [Spirochaetes bacterium]|jgi:zinc/manganese transport system substrate-binding protein|nr:metal ABC transporter substrate-binding protein [Spirochaetota bacterium]
MNKIILIFLFFLVPVSVCAKLKVVASYQYIASLTREIGGDLVDVVALSQGNMDPHTVMPRPSFIAKAARADLLIVNGASLDEAWISPIITQAGNPAIRKGGTGYLDLSLCVRLFEVPASLSRAYGDVHPEGNPHFHLDPDNVPAIARAIRERLSKLDPPHSGIYTDHESGFKARWMKKSSEWSAAMKIIAGRKIIQYHSLYYYFFRRYGIETAGFIEPLPGIPPSSKHLSLLVGTIRSEKVDLIVQDVYHPDDAARYLSRETGARIVKIPHDVGAVENAKDIYLLFDEIILRLTK